MQPKCRIGLRFFFTSRWIVLSGMALAAIAGCKPPTSTTPSAKPLTGIVLRVAASPDNAVRSMVERHSRPWCESNAVTIEYVAETATADIYVFPARRSGFISDRLASLTLTPHRGQDAYDFSGLLPYQSEHNMQWAERAVAVPLLGESLFCIYRADLLEDRRHVAAIAGILTERFGRKFSANGPATWQQAAAIASYFAREPNWIAGENVAVPRPSLPPLASSADEFDREFHAVASSFCRRAINQETSRTLTDGERPGVFFDYQFELNTGKPAIAAAPFVAALKLLQELQVCRPKGTAERPIDALRNGKAIFAVGTLADLAYVQESGSPVRGKVGVWRVPGSDTAFDWRSRRLGPVTDIDGNYVPYLGHGGWMAGVDRNSTKTSAATDLIMYLSSPAVSLEAMCEPAWGGGPTRDTHLSHRPAWHNYDLASDRTQQLISAVAATQRPTILNPTYRLRVVHEEDYLRLFADIVRPALTDGVPPEKALRDVADAWTTTTKDIGAFQREYRNSLGLR